MILVDSSIIIDFLNNNCYKDEITQLIKNKQMVTTPIIVMEILQGIKNDKTYTKIKAFMESLPIVLITYDDYLLSANIYRNCRKRGKTIRKSIDCLIASIAINNNLKLFTRDRDFKQVSECFMLELM